MIRPRPSTRLPFATLPAIAESEQPTVIPDDVQTTGGSAGSGSSGAAGAVAKSSSAATTLDASPSKRRPMLKPAPSSRPRAVLKTPLFTAADFPMVLSGLLTSSASSPATTLAPETPWSKALPGPMSSSAPSTVPMGPPPVARATPKSKRKAKPTREQAQTEIATSFREASSVRNRRGRWMMLCWSTIFFRQDTRTLCLNHTWVFCPWAPRTGWDVTLHDSSSSGYSLSTSKMTSHALISCRPRGQGIGSPATSVCFATDLWRWSGEPRCVRQPAVIWHLGSSTACIQRAQMRNTGRGSRIYPCARGHPDNDPYLAQIMTTQNVFLLAFFAFTSVLKYLYYSIFRTSTKICPKIGTKR